MPLIENSEAEFGKWLDQCLKDGREKLDLTWVEVAFQLLGKAQKALLLEMNKPQT